MRRRRRGKKRGGGEGRRGREKKRGYSNQKNTRAWRLSFTLGDLTLKG